MIDVLTGGPVEIWSREEIGLGGVIGAAGHLYCTEVMPATTSGALADIGTAAA
jgi:hypothetical protein